MEIKKRPIGVTIIAILIIIGGILLLLAGIGVIAVGSLFISQIIGLGFVIIGAIILAVGIGYIVVSYGLLKGKRWAWTITVVLLFIGIAINVVSIIFGSFAINMDISKLPKIIETTLIAIPMNSNTTVIVHAHLFPFNNP